MLIFHRPACGDDRLKSPLMINVQIPLKMCKNNVRFFLLLLFLDHLNNVEQRYRIEAIVREVPGTDRGVADTVCGLSDILAMDVQFMCPLSPVPDIRTGGNYLSENQRIQGEPKSFYQMMHASPGPQQLIVRMSCHDHYFLIFQEIGCQQKCLPLYFIFE